MIFHDITLADGAVHSRRKHESRDLVRAAVDLFVPLLPEPFEQRAVPTQKHVAVTWLPEDDGTAMFTLYSTRTPPAKGGESIPLVTCVLLSGRSAEADHACALALQAAIELMAAPGHEPGYDLLSQKSRPLLAACIHPSGVLAPQDMMLVADIEVCLAAAFFESLVEGQA